MMLTAKTSAQLNKQIERYNEGRSEADKLHCNWGREGTRGTWFAHGAYGNDLKTVLHFSGVIMHLQAMIDLSREFRG